jgi:hypothetical protein
LPIPTIAVVTATPPLLDPANNEAYPPNIPTASLHGITVKGDRCRAAPGARAAPALAGQVGAAGVSP